LIITSEVGDEVWLVSMAPGEIVEPFAELARQSLAPLRLGPRLTPGQVHR